MVHLWTTCIRIPCQIYTPHCTPIEYKSLEGGQYLLATLRPLKFENIGLTEASIFSVLTNGLILHIYLFKGCTEMGGVLKGLILYATVIKSYCEEDTWGEDK